MSRRGIAFSSEIIMALVILILSTALHIEIYHLAVAVETGMETPEEHAREENNSVQNGFSSAVPNPNLNMTQVENNLTKSTNLALTRLISGGSPVYGNHSAPVTIIEFGDFQCQFCDRFAKQTEPLINSTYLQTGKANLVFRHFVTHGPDSLTGAMASQCANDQGKFWSFYKTLYDNQGEENSGWANADNMKKFAAGISGIDAQKFNTCIDSQKYKGFVENDTKFATTSGFQGTPTFIIQNSDGSNREVLLGAYPFPSFQSIIGKKISER
jgi:protein-disulfide isomerase